MASIGDCPASLKPISHYLKLAQEHDTRKNEFLSQIRIKTVTNCCILSIFIGDPVVSYWSRLYALQTGLKLSKKEVRRSMTSSRDHRFSSIHKHSFNYDYLFLFSAR